MTAGRDGCTLTCPCGDWRVGSQFFAFEARPPAEWPAATGPLPTWAEPEDAA